MAGHAMYNLTSSDGTTAQAALGQSINVKGAGWMYVIADGAITANQCCLIEADVDAIPITTTLMGTVARPTMICIPQFAAADNEYFWAPVGPFFKREDGVTTFKVLAANAATSVRLYTTGTAGVLDDAVTTGLIEGLALTETVTTQEAADCVAVKSLTSFCEL